MSAPNELRVFISSTFRDLQEEREHLIKKIFPEIRATCRERGIRFTEVDLRWGLTDEDVALGRVIRTCLEEVDKCRPYFIGITGSRYGYIPSHLDIFKDPSLQERYPWLEEAVVDQMSITEMEGVYGVLNPPSDRIPTGSTKPGLYFFRAIPPVESADAEALEELERLQGYQQRIRRSGASVTEFTDVETLGAAIRSALETIIAEDYGDTRPPTPLEEERSRHEAFSQSRRRAYIPNPAYLKRLNDHVNANGPPLVVYAESGSGKSSLFAYWAEQCRRKNPELHVVEHYVGIGATATDHYAVIRHICMEIKERFGRTEEIPTDPSKLELALGQWLGYADHELTKRGQQMVLILDGLNQLQGTALNLRWIPDATSPSIRLILSSTVEGTLVELRKRGWSEFGMQALSEAERETIVVRYLAEYHKSLNPEQIKRIAGDYKCGHPLFLKTVLEELRLVGRHEELDAKIESYLNATGTEDLFQRVLERLEEDYNMRSVRDMMTLLSASRSGLDERELSEISGIARLKIATMTAGLDYHLVRKVGRLTFFHDYLRRAVDKRYLSDETKRRAAHLQLAEYFHSSVSASIAAGRSLPVRMASELCYQLKSCGAIDRLRERLSSMPVFLALHAGPTKYEVLGYWSSLVEGSDVVGMYRRGLTDWSIRDAEERGRGMGEVSLLLERLGEWVGARELERDRLASAIEHGLRREEAASRRRLGWLLVLHNEYAEALEELRQALDLFTELGERRGIAIAIGNMGVVHYHRGDYDHAIECYERQLSIDEEVGDRHEVAYAIGNIGSVYANRGEYDRALECYERQLRIAEELGDRSGISMVIGNMGIVYDVRRKFDRALECYERQLSIAEELGDRSGILMAIGNMGVSYYMRGEYDRALERHERQLSIAEELGDRGSASNAIGCMAVVFARRGEYDRALKCYEQQLSIAEELGNRRFASLAIGNMGAVYQELGAHDRALESYHRAVEGHRVIGYRHGLTHWLLGIGQVMVELAQAGGKLPEYLPTYLSNVTIDRWQAIAVDHARTCTEECIAISDDLSKPDTMFDGRVHLARIEAAEGRIDVASQRLYEMLENAADDAQRAELHYRLWKLDERGHAAQAVALYKALYAATPNHEHLKRIEELTAAGDQT